MGCEVVVAGADQCAVADVFERYERVFSLYRPESELSRVNASRKPSVVVSPLFAGVLERALAAAEETCELVEPTLAGRRAEVRLEGLVLRRPPGVALDLNGVVKAIAVDEAARLVDEGFVSVGGDLAVRGAVDVGLPGGGAVGVLSGGLATSGRGRRPEHLIDPRTGRPSTSRWQAVTVAGETCLAADVAAKAAFLLDRDGPGWLEERRMPGRFLDRSGRVVSNLSWFRAAWDVPACT
jgi:thiamine biosynthesis lipoprotein